MVHPWLRQIHSGWQAHHPVSDCQKHCQKDIHIVVPGICLRWSPNIHRFSLLYLWWILIQVRNQKSAPISATQSITCREVVSAVAWLQPQHLKGGIHRLGASAWSSDVQQLEGTR